MNFLLSSLLTFVRWFLDAGCRVYGSVFWPSARGRIPPLTERLILKPAHEVADLIRKGEVRSEDVVRAYINRIKEVNPLINAVVDERFEAAIADAKKIDEQVESELSALEDGSFVTSLTGSLTREKRITLLPLLGIPFTCKDSFAIRGMICSAGLPQKKDFRPDFDASVIRNMRAAGAIPLVVGNVPEMLIWWTAENKSFGRTNNPYDLSCICGGSSGGDCSLLSSGAAILSVGSDIGGSIRIPCCMCGVFGHKTTPAVISADGKIPALVPAREPYFSMGPMTRFATDLKPMVKAMAGSAISKMPHIDDPVDFSKVKIFYMLDDEDPMKTRVNWQIKQSILKAVSHFNTEFKSPIQQVTFPDFRQTAKIFLSTMAQTGGDSMITQISEGGPQLNVYTEFLKSLVGLSAHTKHILMFSLLQHLLPGKDSKWMRDGVALGKKLKKELHDILNSNAAGHSILIMPSYPEHVPKHGTTIPKNANISYFTILNLLEVPATQVPIGLDKENGTPLGIQVATSAFNDHVSIETAVHLERLFGGWVPPAPFLNHQN